MEDSANKKLYALSQISRVKLKQILISIKGQKNLVIDEKLIKPLDRVCDMNWLRQQGIEKVFKFSSAESHNNLKIVYFIPASLITLKLVFDQIHSYIGKGRNPNDQDNHLGNLNFHVIIFPKVLMTFKTLLEEEGLYDIVALHSFQWELIYMDSNMLSLEYPNLFKSLFVKCDTSTLSCVANSLWTFCQTVGKPNIIVSLGQHSNNVLNMFNRYCDYHEITKRNTDFGSILIMDRDLDYASTLLVPATYSGLLNEVFPVKCGAVNISKINNKISSGKLLYEKQKSDENGTPTLIHLNSHTDSIYNDIKFKHFSVIFSELCIQAKALNMQKTHTKNYNLNEIKHFVENKLQEVSVKKRDLANHLLACETIISEFGNMFELVQNSELSMMSNSNKKNVIGTIEELMSINIHKETVLKLLCLCSMTHGISYDDYSSLANKYLHSFGYHHLHVFQNLSNAGLFVQPSNKFSITIPNLATISASFPKQQSYFQANANKLKLLPGDSEVNVKDPNCPSYVFGGMYIPMVAQAARFLTQSQTYDDFSNKFSLFSNVKLSCHKLQSDNPGYDKFLKNNSYDLKELNDACKNIKIELFPLHPRSLLIFVIGGITYAEMAACNFIEKQTGTRIILAGDSIISGSDLINSAIT